MAARPARATHQRDRHRPLLGLAPRLAAATTDAEVLATAPEWPAVFGAAGVALYRAGPDGALTRAAAVALTADALSPDVLAALDAALLDDDRRAGDGAIPLPGAGLGGGDDGAVLLDLRGGPALVGCLALVGVEERGRAAGPVWDSAAAQLAAALDRARLFEDARRNAGRARLLADAGRAFAQLSVEDAVRAVTALTTRVLGDGCWIALCPEEGGDALIVSAHHRVPEKQMILEALVGAAVRPDQGESGRVLATGQTLAGPQPPPDVVAPERRAVVQALGVHARIAVALRGHDRVIGVLMCQATEPGTILTADDVPIAEELGRKAAGAVEHARLFEQARRREREAALLAEAGRLFHASLSLSEVLPWVVELAVEEIGDAACIFLVDEREEGLTLAASSFISAEVGARWRGYLGGKRGAPGDGLRGVVLDTGEPLLLADAAGDPRADRDFVAALGIGSWLGVPLLGQYGPLGVLTISTNQAGPRARRRFDGGDLRLAAALAQRAATAIENARLYEQAQRRERDAALLAEAGRRFNASLDVPLTLAAVVELAGRALGDTASLFLVDPGRPELRLAAHYHANPDERDRRRAEILADPPRRGEGYIGTVVNGGPPVLIRDLQEDMRAVRRHVERLGLRAWLCVPLSTEDEILGVLTVGMLSPARTLDERDLDLAQAIAARAAAAIDHARLHRDRQRGALLQATIAALAREVGGTLEPGDVAQRLATALQRNFADSVAGVFLHDEARQDLALRGFATHAEHERAADGSLRLALGEGVVGWAGERREAAVVPDVRADARYVTLPGTTPLAARAELAVPILGDDGLLGVIDLESERPAAFDADDLFVVRAVARHAAVALDNARLHGATVRAVADLRAVLESIEQGIVMTDRAGRVRFANRRAGDLLGVDIAAVVGRNKLELAEGVIKWRMRDPLGFMSRLGWLYDHPEEMAVDEVLVARPEARILQRYSGPMRDPATAALLGRIEVYSDVTAERRLERAKDEFLATASHELKTPITTLGGYLEMLQRQFARPAGPDLGRVARYVDTALGEMDRLRRLAENLLEVARIEAGGLVLHRAPADLAAWARELVERFVGHPGVRQRNHHLRCRADGPLPASFDALRLGQVLTNLLDNALKYTPAGGEVWVVAERRDGEAWLSVRDSGIGVPEPERERLFLPFYRAVNASAGSPEGLGLGLYISRGIVEGHGGRLWVEAAPGGGSVFTIALPLSGVGQSGSRAVS
ncbi:MAG TPA: GAF domain-containing protein [Thermomicrobiales bacterium]|nr:GAF domain-containing protein [Thermomicrobiales bacterium]